MTQFFLNGAIKNALTGGVPRELSNSEKIGAAVGSGVLSSVVASPLELMMVQQQVKGTGLLETAVSLVKGGPVLARGMIGMMGREGIFCGCYLGIMPVVRAESRAHAKIARVVAPSQWLPVSRPARRPTTGCGSQSVAPSQTPSTTPSHWCWEPLTGWTSCWASVHGAGS